MTSTSNAEIYERGYRAYDGPRATVWSAMLSVFVVSIQRALGLRRKFRFKVIPTVTIFIAYVPALVFMGLAVLIPDAADIVAADYAGYFGLLSLAVLLFTAFVAPELLSTDRQSGMFGLYLASPLDRTKYLLAKGASLVAVLFLVTLFPVIFLLIGYSFADFGPGGVFDTIEVIAKIMLSGLVLSLFFTLIGMAASTMTSRQGFASAGIVMVMIGSGVFTGVLLNVADAPDWVQLFNLSGLPFDLVNRIFDEQQDQIVSVSTLGSFGAWALVCGVCAGIIALGYRRLEVTK